MIGLRPRDDKYPVSPANQKLCLGPRTAQPPHRLVLRCHGTRMLQCCSIRTTKGWAGVTGSNLLLVFPASLLPLHDQDLPPQLASNPILRFHPVSWAVVAVGLGLLPHS
jgi:hypothetical protein